MKIAPLFQPIVPTAVEGVLEPYEGTEDNCVALQLQSLFDHEHCAICYPDLWIFLIFDLPYRMISDRQAAGEIGTCWN